MEDSSIWAKRPHHVFRSPTAREPSSTSDIHYTWAGPIDPKLYSDSLTQLCKQTEHSLNQLEKMKQRPWPSISRSKTDSAKLSPWHDSTVMFAPRDAFHVDTKSTPRDDDMSSIASYTGPTNHCYLCSTLEEHQKHLLRMRHAVKKKDPPKQRIKYIAPLPKVRQKMEEEDQEIYDSRYKVVVWTGNEPGATTDANVYITIKGRKNVLHKTRLYRGSTNKRFCFCRGSRESFFIKSPALGNLEILTIEHDGLEKYHSWYCEKIEVTCMRTLRVWVFTCKNWLSLHRGDFLISRDLLANYVERKIHEYELIVTTGKKQFAGTDANVYVTFRGTEGASPKIKLSDSSKKLFQKGSVDHFRVRFHDIGEIQNLRIEHDGRGLASGWYLESVVLQNLNDRDTIYYFVLNGWMARDIGNGALWREIKAKRKLAQEVTTEGRRIRTKPSGKQVKYSVTVRTGDVRYAGTDANVYIIIQGKKGKTKKLFMDDARNNFERGMTENFELTAFNAGPVTRINIGHDNSGPGAGWYCEDITVKKYLTKEEVADFLHQAKKEKKVKDRRRQQQRRDRSRGADGGEASEIDDEESHDGKEDKYKDLFDRDGRIAKVPVYEEYYFVCKNWLAIDEGDGLLERELEPKKKLIFFRDL